MGRWGDAQGEVSEAEVAVRESGAQQGESVWFPNVEAQGTQPGGILFFEASIGSHD